jgi:ABC-2 type transport system permease protein
MVLASLFLVWGREAWHMGQLLTEPVYFISGLNFPVARLGMLGALSVALIPLATGLDAMRQLAFAGAAFPAGTPSPLVEIGILVVMSIGSILAARWMLLAMERRARRDGRLSVRWQ